MPAFIQTQAFLFHKSPKVFFGQVIYGSFKPVIAKFANQ